MENATKRIVIVGGVAAGASAATKARRTDEAAEIVVFERGPYVSFANCGLPNYVGGEIRDLDDLLLMTPQRFARRFRIQVKLHHEVVRIDRTSHRIEKDGPLTVYCVVGYRSYHACKILTHHGHEVRNHSGGYTSWWQREKAAIIVGAGPTRSSSEGTPPSW